MNLSIEPDYAAVSCAAAERIARLVRGKPDAAVMVATGNTPRGTYARLAEMARAGARCFLIGEALMRQDDVEQAVRHMRANPVAAQQALETQP